jgi:hypothetical protein
MVEPEGGRAMPLDEMVRQLREQPVEALVRHAVRLDEERSIVAALIRERRKAEADRRAEGPRDKKE